MALIDDVKTALRFSSAATAFNGEIADLIEAAKADLKMAGVDPAKTDAPDPDPLIKRAITVYVKANFGFDNPDADKLQASYESLKAHLSLAGDYRAPEVIPPP